MIYFDICLHKLPEGHDDAPDLTAYEFTREVFSLLPPLWKAKERRLHKQSTRRRIKNPEWARRQRREDRNAQVIY